MKKYLMLILLMLGFFPLSVHEGYAQGKADPPMDIIIVLDNSRSMKANDPEFLTKNAVLSFVNGLRRGTRINIFLDKSDMAKPMITIAETGASGKITQALSRVNYAGERANMRASIEWAIYGLERNARANAEKLVIFMLGGVADPGDRARGAEKSRQLNDTLALKSKEAGIRIFGIAFTSQADFDFVQTLGQKTNGGSYQVLKAVDILGVFSNINEAISKFTPEARSRPSVTPTTQVKPVTPTEVKATTRQKGAIPVKLLLIGLVGLVVLAIVVVVFVFMKRGKKVKFETEEDKEKRELLSLNAALTDMDGVTDRQTYKINSIVTTVGRVKRENIDICIGKNTVSSAHAQIHYRNGNFYLTDLDSTNGTYLNDGKERVSRETRLRNGDIIAFDRYKFQFGVSGRGGLSGTQLRAPSSHGQTMLRPSELQEQPPQPEEVVEEVTPAPVLQREGEEVDTGMDQGMCPNHPDKPATEVCQICGKAKCIECMVERSGFFVDRYEVKICKECAAKTE